MTKLLATALPLTLCLLAAPASAEPGRTATETRQTGTFSAIELAGPFDVLVDTQAPRGVRLTGPAADLADVETITERDTLIVRPRQRNGWHFSFGKRREPVTLVIGAPQLNSLKNGGSSDVQLAHFQGDRLLLAAAGPGDIRAAGIVGELTLRVTGSGDVDVRQLRPATLRAQLSGPGNVEAAGISRELALELTGSGDFAAGELRTDLVTATMRGPGNVTLNGRSKEIRATLQGSGDLETCGLAVEAASATLSGPGNACVSGTIRQMHAEVRGSGDLEARGLQTQRLHVVLAGAGNATLSGTTGTLEAELNGSGDLDGRALQADTANVTVRGPGNATVNVRGKVETQARQGALKGQPGQARLVLVDRRGVHDEGMDD